MLTTDVNRLGTCCLSKAPTVNSSLYLIREQPLLVEAMSNLLTVDSSLTSSEQPLADTRNAGVQS
jgi:hypothetical protein